MPFSLDLIKTQVIASLNAGVRDASGNASYTTTLGDKAWVDGEITRAAQSACTRIMEAICETDGHGHRQLFTSSITLTHGANLPSHFGPIGEPRITPFANAAYKMIGKRKSVEEISAYRANPAKLYSHTAHNLKHGQFPSKLAGFYAIDSGTFYFTGSAAEADITNFVEGDYTKLPDTYYPLAIDGAIGYLIKDGTISDIFAAYAQRFEAGIQAIMGQGEKEPSMEATVGARDTGDV